MNKNVLRDVLQEGFPVECTLAGEEGVDRVLDAFDKNEPLKIYSAEGGDDFNYSEAIDILKIIGEILKIALPIIGVWIAQRDKEKLSQEIKKIVEEKKAPLTDEQILALSSSLIKNIR